MGDDCPYFASERWEERLKHHMDRVWDITDLLDRLETERNREAIIRDHVATAEEDDLDREKLVSRPLSDVVQRDWALPTTLDFDLALETWERSRPFDLPDTCPHEAEESKFCLFHQPVGEKDDAAVRQHFLDCLGDDGPFQFTGAEFGDLNLSRVTLSSPSEHAIVCRFARIEGAFDLEGATVEQDLDLYGAEITAPICRGTTFRGDVSWMAAALGRATRAGRFDVLNGSDFHDTDYFSEFEGEISFADAEFAAQVDFKRTTFGGDTSFNTATFEAVVVYNYASFEGRADFMHAVFARKADFSRAMFADYAVFYAIFQQKAVFNYTHFRGPVDFWSADFHGMTDFWVTTFEEAADFRHADFHEYTSFRETTFMGRADFTGVEFAGGVRFDRLETAEQPLALIDAHIARGRLTQREPGTCLYDFDGATIGDLELSGPNPAALLDDFRFVETTFDGFDFASHREALTPEWSLHRFADGRTPIPTERLESTYLRAKNGANLVGDSKGASEFFLKEMKYRRRRYAETGAYGNWLVNWFYNLTCGYGERPLRTVLFSLGVIGLFAGVYAGAGVEIGQSADGLSYLVFSVQSFVTLILGSVGGGQSIFVRLAAAFEAFVGAFFIALFVFALTRTIHR